MEDPTDLTTVYLPVTSSEPPATPGKPLETAIIGRDPAYGDAIVFMGREIAAAIREGLGAIAEALETRASGTRP